MNSWNTVYQRKISASYQQIWSVLSDTSTWHLWNPGVKSITLHNSFANNHYFLMELPDGEIIKSQLVSVVENVGFTDVTEFGENIITVKHTIEKITEQESLVHYYISVEGFEAENIGQAVSADFPVVLEQLDHYVLSST